MLPPPAVKICIILFYMTHLIKRVYLADSANMAELPF